MQAFWQSAQRGQLLECPVWCAASNALYWIDVVDPSIHRHSFATGEPARWALPKPPGSIALMPEATLLVALRSSLALLDLHSGALRPVPWHGPALAEDRFNDGVTDRQGNFWVATMDRKLAQPLGRVFRFDAGLKATAHAIDARLGNGLCFSPAGERLYVSRTVERDLLVFDVDAQSGALSHRRTLLALDDAPGRPDGCTVAADGTLWSARVGGGCIDHYAADGRVLGQLALPTSHPTHCVFGGEDLRTLFVVTSRFGPEFAAGHVDDGVAGRVLAYRMDQPGLPPAQFAR